MRWNWYILGLKNSPIGVLTLYKLGGIKKARKGGNKIL